MNRPRIKEDIYTARTPIGRQGVGESAEVVESAEIAENAEVAESTEIAENAEVTESAEIVERTEDSRECRKFQNSINIT
ncbi:hypothetical protein Tco_0419945, partial [Tanacetum coccineum]